MKHDRKHFCYLLIYCFDSKKNKKIIIYLHYIRYNDFIFETILINLLIINKFFKVTKGFLNLKMSQLQSRNRLNRLTANP